MDVGRRLNPILTNGAYAFLFFASIAIVPRLLVWAFFPLDWNWDSYHHWQISYLTLKVGLSRGRMWDLNGCEYYWGMVPHLVQAFLLWVFHTATIVPYRALNVMLGGANAYLVYLIGRGNFDPEVGRYAGLIFALFPITVVFDAIAMQETLALFLVLLSLHLFVTRPFWSGFFLALACQSRIEFWLVSLIFVVGIILVERASTRIVPFVVSWLLATGAFCWFFATRTGDAFYPLYWSVYNSIGGWSGTLRGKPFLQLMSNWIALKLRTWPTKPTGIVLLGSMFAFVGVFVHMLLKRWRRYHLYLFFMTSLVVFGLIFIPYFGKSLKSLLLMLRMSIPVAALGSILLSYMLFRARLPRCQVRLRRCHIEKILITLLSYAYFIPVYERFQVSPRMAFTAADRAMEYYRSGTIVCDCPTMNYRFASRWRIKAINLLGNHYSPAYYGVSDPVEYARWFEEHNITLWIYVDSRAYPMWSIASRNFPDLLVYENESYGKRFYTVNQTALELALTG